ncbi:MAG: PIN domain-containing protein [Chloroflexota bacterium]
MASTGSPDTGHAEEPPSAFLDASVLMAAALSESGHAHDLFGAAQRSGLALCTSTFALKETERNLYRKAPRGLRAFWDLQSQMMIIDPTPELVVQVAVDIEPKDAAIVAGAVAARTRFLVTYDRRHLLAEAELIRQRYHIETLTPGELLTRQADTPP